MSDGLKDWTCLYICTYVFIPGYGHGQEKAIFTHTATLRMYNIRNANKKIKSHKTRDTQQGEGRPRAIVCV